MKKSIIFIPSFIIMLLGGYFPAKADHLEGLWRNDRLRITLRIEQEPNGFKSKRTDEGIWYHYTTEDNRYYVDRNGNWYELIDRDELVWNEAKTDKRIKFLRVDEQDYNQWNDRGDSDYYDQDYNDRNRYDHQYHTDYNDRNYQLEGTWFKRNGRDNIQIIPFKGGIRVKSDHNGWEKFYADRSATRYRSNDGNTIAILDDEHIRLRSQYGKWEEIYTRYRSWNHNRNYRRD